MGGAPWLRVGGARWLSGWVPWLSGWGAVAGWGWGTVAERVGRGGWGAAADWGWGWGTVA